MYFSYSLGETSGKSKFNILLSVFLVLAGAFEVFGDAFVGDLDASTGFGGCFLSCLLGCCSGSSGVLNFAGIIISLLGLFVLNICVYNNFVLYLHNHFSYFFLLKFLSNFYQILYIR
jgi:hypothetical protein